MTGVPPAGTTLDPVVLPGLPRVLLGPTGLTGLETLARPAGVPVTAAATPPDAKVAVVRMRPRPLAAAGAVPPTAGPRRVPVVHGPRVAAGAAFGPAHPPQAGVARNSIAFIQD